MSEKKFEIKKIEKLPDSEATITGEITLPFLVELRKEALANLNKTLSLPGFRVGRIPEDILIKNFGEMKVLEETAELALGREYPNIVEEAKLRPIVRPQISITKLAPGIPLEFKIDLILAPEFDLPDYKKIAKEVKETDQDKRRIKIVEEIVKKIEIKLPKKIVEHEVAHMLHHFRQDVEKAGIKWEEYLDKIQKKEDEITDEWRKGVEDKINGELVFSRIAEKENLKTYKEVFEMLEA